MFVWSGAVFLLWLKGHINLSGGSSAPRGWKSIVTLAEAMRQEFKQANIDPSTTTDKQLKDDIRAHLHGGTVSFATALQDGNCGLHKGIGKWLAKEAFWCVAVAGTGTVASCIVLLSFSSYIHLRYFFPVWLWVTFLGQIFGMLIGKTNRSRLFLALCWLVYYWVACWFSSSVLDCIGLEIRVTGRSLVRP
jgi:hypothetical protein